MVGLGNTAKKIQTLADRAEETYKRLNDLREQMNEMREKVGDTHDKVASLERDVEEQRALVEAVARETGVDVESVLTEAAIEEAEGEGADAGADAAGTDGTDGTDGETNGATGTGSGE